MKSEGSLEEVIGNPMMEVNFSERWYATSAGGQTESCQLSNKSGMPESFPKLLFPSQAGRSDREGATAIFQND